MTLLTYLLIHSLPAIHLVGIHCYKLWVGI